ncbi:Ataxin-2, C-terminal [Cynara cardunculus var. scolymus]|uniref:Ataxin-2, C-terminal n=1 Tax=Cynara cardunculus var. scolymus TaxID=59895 RepID=A0A103Y3T8_CYNCS|nr:Ataxin-2, C-terminal [Cynara cardunculus var. scolymus]
MAQAQPEEKLQENREKETSKKDEKREISNSPSFKLNAHAPEFVPSSHTQIPVSGYFYPCFSYLGVGGNDGSGSADWVYVGGGDQDQQVQFFSNPDVVIPNCSRNCLTEDLQQKIIKQVECQFSGLSLLANESLVKHISKDPEGYVPISVIASMKKSRTVVAENLPEDHSHQNLEKIFSVILESMFSLKFQSFKHFAEFSPTSSVKAIRICHPPEPNSSRSRGDYVFSNKLHALVEYETAEMAEKAVRFYYNIVDKLNDERNWRKGLRVRLLIRRSPKSVLKSRKSEFDELLDDESDEAYDASEESSQTNVIEVAVDNNLRTPTHNGRGVLSQSPQTSGSPYSETSSTKQSSPKGPRMPDGTRGFTMGRGKPMSPPALTTTP